MTEVLNSIEKILIIRLSSLGDVILTTPVIRSLKKAYPNLKIDFVVKKEYSAVVENSPYLDNVFTYQSFGKDINSYGAVLDLQNNRRSNKLRKNFSGITFSYRKPSAEKFLLVNFKINLLRDKIPVPVRYAQSIPGLKLDEEGSEIYLPPELNTPVEQNKNRIALCPGSRHFTKMWVKEYYVKIAELLIEMGFEVVLIGGSSDKIICMEIAEITGAKNLATDDDLYNTVINLKKCSMALCNDSGMMHTAAAAKIPVAAIFGSTVEEFGFFPYKAINLVLENKSLSCRPCSHIGRNNCPKNHFKCMKEIKPEYVLEQILKFKRQYE